MKIKSAQEMVDTGKPVRQIHDWMAWGEPEERFNQWVLPLFIETESEVLSISFLPLLFIDSTYPFWVEAKERVIKKFPKLEERRMKKWELKLRNAVEPIIVEAHERVGTHSAMEFRRFNDNGKWSLVSAYNDVEWWRESNL